MSTYPRRQILYTYILDSLTIDPGHKYDKMSCGHSLPHGITPFWTCPLKHPHLDYRPCTSCPQNLKI